MTSSGEDEVLDKVRSVEKKTKKAKKHKKHKKSSKSASVTNSGEYLLNYGLFLGHPIPS